MTESFENLGNNLRDWAKDKGTKGRVQALNRYRKKEEDKAISLFRN